MSDYEKNKWEHILLLGCDSQVPGEYERSDVMMILSINKEKNLVRLTSLLRDLWVGIPGLGTAKINAATSAGGPELAVKTVNQLLDLNITRYVMLNFSAAVKIINLMGGIDLDITENERLHINIWTMDTMRILETDKYVHIPPLENAGTVHLRGEQVIAHMRNRYDSDGDYGRTGRQRTVMIKLLDKFKNEMSYVKKIKAILTGLKCARTNLTIRELCGLWRISREMDMRDITTFRIPADGTYTEINEEVWHFETDFATNKYMFYEFLEEMD